MDLVLARELSFDYMHRVVKGVTIDDYARPTPCSEWDVSDGVLDTEMNAGARVMPGRVYASINQLDTFGHSWDLATATGQDATIDDELAMFALAFSEQVLSPDDRGGRFDSPVLTDRHASPTERLVGFFGRKP